MKFSFILEHRHTNYCKGMDVKDILFAHDNIHDDDINYIDICKNRQNLCMSYNNMNAKLLIAFLNK